MVRVFLIFIISLYTLMTTEYVHNYWSYLVETVFFLLLINRNDLYLFQFTEL